MFTLLHHGASLGQGGIAPQRVQLRRDGGSANPGLLKDELAPFLQELQEFLKAQEF